MNSAMQMSIAKYAGLSLKELLTEVLNPYPEVVDGLKRLTDGQSPEYRAFHAQSLAEHVSGLMIRQKGLTYWLYRKSNIRNTPAYETYQFHLYDEQVGDYVKDDVNVAGRYMTSQWGEWFTIRLNEGSTPPPAI